MSILAGALSLDPRAPLDDKLCDQLKGALSRKRAGTTVQFRDDRCFLVKLDLGAFQGKGSVVLAEGRGASMVVGEPLLDGSRSSGRDSDLETLLAAWSRRENSALTRARGVFSLVHYDAREGRLGLVTDKLGIRPLYWYKDNDILMFATALRILEMFDVCTQSLDLRGVCELIRVGYSLEGRTPYHTIKHVRPAVIVDVDRCGVHETAYWRWESVCRSTSSIDELAATAHERFVEGVALRKGSDRSATAFLSGGLDSRCAVAALRSLGVEVHSFSFASPETQDGVFAERAAEALGTIPHPVPPRPLKYVAFPQFSALMARALDAIEEIKVDRPRVAWSGDGGSVGVGSVYVTPEILTDMMSGSVETAVASFLRSYAGSIPERIVRNQVLLGLDGSLEKAFRTELSLIDCEDPGKSFHLLLMLTDQHHHLTTHYEDLDIHGIELELPFFDSKFLETVLSVPTGHLLGHRFYHRWLEYLPASVRQVPWQVYPGHLPCPVQAPVDLPAQWDESRQRLVAERRRSHLLSVGMRIATERHFPDAILRRWPFLAAMLLYKMHLRDYGYLVRTAAVVDRVWQVSEGRRGASR